MRNLLSFVLGVISRLLYLLLRLILLLDRTICRIYDLPVRRRCSAAGRPPPFGLCAERIRAAVPAACSAADQAGHAAACGRSAARCYRGQRNAAERSKRG